jgi:hypothetical protein
MAARFGPEVRKEKEAPSTSRFLWLRNKAADTILRKGRSFLRYFDHE